MNLRRRKPPASASQWLGEPGTVDWALAALMRLKVQNKGHLPLVVIGTGVDPVSGFTVRQHPEHGERVVML